VEDKKDLFQLLNEIKKSTSIDLESAKEQAIKTLVNKP